MILKVTYNDEPFFEAHTWEDIKFIVDLLVQAYTKFHVRYDEAILKQYCHLVQRIDAQLSVEECDFPIGDTYQLCRQDGSIVRSTLPWYITSLFDLSCGMYGFECEVDTDKLCYMFTQQFRV